MPALGLGLSPLTTMRRRLSRLRKPVGNSTRDAVTWGVELGYRLFDTASSYNNEKEVGQALRESGVRRRELFITTKLREVDQGYDEALRACESSLQKLQTSYLDLYLIHWPVSGKRAESWRALERLVEERVCRAIGVSNFTVRHLRELLESAQIPPAVNQVEFSPFLYQRELLTYCREHAIQLESYCPLARGSRLQEPAILGMSAKYGRTPSQLLLRWALEHDLVVIPKSIHRRRIAENRDVFDFRLDTDDMAALDALDEGFRLNRDPTDVL
jgi:diketogulonate reductase-like aldo/keto reductase